MNYPFVNHFDGPRLKRRIRQLNETPSDRGWWRYGLMWLLTVVLVVACQNWRQAEEEPVIGYLRPLNGTRRQVLELEKDPVWQNEFSFYQTRDRAFFFFPNNAAVIVALIDGHLTLKKPYDSLTRVFVNRKEVPVAALHSVTPLNLKDIFVLKRPDAFPGTPEAADPRVYRLLIETGPDYRRADPERQHLLGLLEAAAVTDRPQGVSHMFTMNELLEATYFKLKTPFVARTKNHHLRVYDEYRTDLTIFIDGRPAMPEHVERLHIREIQSLNARETGYTEWRRTDHHRITRYQLWITTAPQRAQRDSSYYVFSPFYSGDF